MKQILPLAFLLLLTACTPPLAGHSLAAAAQRPADTPTWTPAPTEAASATPEPTLLVMPTFTPTATPTYTPTPTLVPTPAPLLTFRVLSYNILYGAGAERQFDSALPTDWVGKSRLPDLLSFIKQANPDIWGIEEANGWDRGTPSTIDQVARDLSMNAVLVTTPLDFHLGLLTKFAILETQDLSPQVGRRGALRATLKTPDGQRLHVFLVHLDPASPEARLCEVNTLLLLAQPYLHERTLLIGDFNFKPDSPEYARLAQSAQSVAVEKSWGIDQIWIAPASPWSSTAWFQSLTLPTGVSDHNPIGAEISLYPSSTPIPTLVLSTPLLLSPTPTVAAPAFAAEILNGVKVSHFDGFDNVCPFAVWTSRWKTERVSNGILEIAGEASWQASVSRYRDFLPGQGVLLRFRFTRGSELEIGFENRAWNTELYRRVGANLREDAAQAVIWQGATDLRGENLKGNLYPKPDTWYQLLLALDKQNEFVAQMWEPGDPSHALRYRGHIGDLPAPLPWTFSIGADKGHLSIDDYIEFSFDAIR